MLDFATCLQLCCITSATLMSREYHKNVQTSRGPEAILQKKYRCFKNSLHFYRNPSVTNSPKMLHLCCVSPKISRVQQTPHTFWGIRVRFVLYISVFICTYLHNRVSVYAFVAPLRIPFSAPIPRKANWSRCAVSGTTSPSLKSIKRGRRTSLCNGLSQFRLCY